MTAAEQLHQLKTENELLQIQLQDLNEMIRSREEELALLRKKASDAVEYKCQVVETLYEVEQMQNELGIQQQQAEGAASREAEMETEILRSIQVEKDLNSLKARFSSTEAALQMTNEELSASTGWYKQLSQYKARVAELESNLEIALLDNDSLKDDIIDLKAQMEELRKKNIG